jgi:hypothetical protein
MRSVGVPNIQLGVHASGWDPQYSLRQVAQFFAHPGTWLQSVAFPCTPLNECTIWIVPVEGLPCG